MHPETASFKGNFGQMCEEKNFVPLFMCFHIIWVLGWEGGGLPKGLGHNLLKQFYCLGNSKMVVPLPFLRCFAEGNRISSQNQPQNLHPNLQQRGRT